jgi:electron transfer flavoprotein beta subunit
MKIVTPVQMVPDLVEELSIDPEGNRLDPYCIRWVINEFDDFAIEQAILLKERNGGKVTILAPGMDGADDALFNAAAKGADELVKLNADFENEVNTHAFARLFAPLISKIQPDLILTGVQVHHHNDGSLGPMLAGELGLPYVGYVSGITLENGKILARKEYPGGVIAEIEVALPAVIGIQASDTPPRYVPISKIRQVMKTSKVAEEDAGEIDLQGGCSSDKMYLPQISGQVTMLEGSVEEIASQLAGIFKEAGVL